jgi:hypothetical protein
MVLVNGGPSISNLQPTITIAQSQPTHKRPSPSQAIYYMFLSWPFGSRVRMVFMDHKSIRRVNAVLAFLPRCANPDTGLAQREIC